MVLCLILQLRFRQKPRFLDTLEVSCAAHFVSAYTGVHADPLFEGVSEFKHLNLKGIRAPLQLRQIEENGIIMTENPSTGTSQGGI